MAHTCRDPTVGLARVVVAVTGGQMDRYIAVTILKSALVVLLCLLTLVTLFTLVDEFRDITPGYTKSHALQYVVYSTPRQLYELLPYGVFIGALVGLGMLASRSELTVLRGAGVSMTRLFAAAGVPVLVVVALNQVLGEFVAPVGETAASSLKLTVQRGDGDGEIVSSHWVRQGPLITNVGGFGASGELIGVRQYELRDGKLALTRHAEGAVFIDDGNGSGHWLLKDVAETRFDAGATRVQRYDELRWRTGANPRLLSAKALFDPAKLSFADLRFQIDYMVREGLDPTRYQVSFWNKALQPVAVLGLVLVALAFVAGPLREAGMGARLSVGLAVGLAFKYLVDVFGPISVVFSVPPWLAMAVPVAVCWLAGALLIRRL